MKVFPFQKERKLDNIVEASFALLRKHFLPIFSLLWKYNSVLIILFILGNFTFNYLMLDKLLTFQNGVFSQYEISLILSDPKTIIIYLTYWLLATVFYARFYATVMGYVRVYKENNGQVISEKVGKIIHQKYWALIKLSILLFLMYVISVALLVVFIKLLAPGSQGVLLILLFIWLIAFIYFVVNYVFTYPAVLFEDASVFGSFSTARKYVKNRWWYAFLTLFVMGIILWLLGLVLQAPLLFYENIKDILGLSEEKMLNINKHADLVYSVLSTIMIMIDYIFKTAFLFTVALLFFSMKEYHTHESILDKIDKIGKSDEK